ncbi:unnamed protein product [Fusarium graminearum]|nr:unnamed protein product [Fusarium graminearum]
MKISRTEAAMGVVSNPHPGNGEDWGLNQSFYAPERPFDEGYQETRSASVEQQINIPPDKRTGAADEKHHRKGNKPLPSSYKPTKPIKKQAANQGRIRKLESGATCQKKAAKNLQAAIGQIQRRLEEMLFRDPTKKDNAVGTLSRSMDNDLEEGGSRHKADTSMDIERAMMQWNPTQTGMEEHFAV